MDKIIEAKIYLPIIYIVIGFVLYYLLKKINDKLSKKIVINKTGSDKRKNTIISLINNIIKYIIAIVIVLAILKVYGVDTTSILASLGIIAVVIGLAFQDIVKDMLSGISIIFDNLYAVGDTIKIGDFTGEVISIGIKNTKIKSCYGEIKSISNSQVTEVINYSLYDRTLFIPVNVSYDTDIEKLEKVLNEVKEEIKTEDGVKSELELLGIDSLNDSGITYMVTLTCKYSNSFRIKRRLLGLIKSKLVENKIEIPYNKLDVNVRK